MVGIVERVDKFGDVRRCGSLPKTAGFVSAFRTFEGEFPVWTDAQIQQALTSPGRRVARQIFGPEWIPDQRSTCACNGWAEANAYSRARFLGGKKDGAIFSGAYIYSLINGGQDQGSSLEDGMKAATEKGNVLRSVCPWNLIYRRNTTQFDAQAAQERAADAYAVQTLRGLRTAGAAGFQLICAVQVGDTWETLDQNGISGIDDGPGNHAVCCDDMLINQCGVEVFDCVMDWGLQHGVQGKTFLTINHFKQTFPNHQFYALPIGQAGLN